VCLNLYSEFALTPVSLVTRFKEVRKLCVKI
jgi:hypothetical protein